MPRRDAVKNEPVYYSNTVRSFKIFWKLSGFFTVEVSLKQKHQIGLPQVAYSFSENGGKKMPSRILRKRKFRARDCFVTRLDR